MDLETAHRFLELKFLHRLRKIASNGLLQCPLLRIVVIDGGCRLKINRELQLIKPFIVYEDSEMKNSRHLIHLGVG
jgi:hypothetical protein